jgi:hypothetical protein
VPSSLVLTYPSLFLSKSINISLISLAYMTTFVSAIL